MPHRANLVAKRHAESTGRAGQSGVAVCRSPLSSRQPYLHHQSESSAAETHAKTRACYTITSCRDRLGDELARPFNCKSVPTCFLSQSAAGHVPSAAAPKPAQSAVGAATARPLAPLSNPGIRTRGFEPASPTPPARPHPAPRAPRSPPNRAERPRLPAAAARWRPLAAARRRPTYPAPQETERWRQPRVPVVPVLAGPLPRACRAPRCPGSQAASAPPAASVIPAAEREAHRIPGGQLGGQRDGRRGAADSEGTGGGRGEERSRQ